MIEVYKEIKIPNPHINLREYVVYRRVWNAMTMFTYHIQKDKIKSLMLTSQTSTSHKVCNLHERKPAYAQWIKRCILKRRKYIGDYEVFSCTLCNYA